jgi:myo-inositol-1(or 4)-monophosphatase
VADDSELVQVLHAAADAVVAALGDLEDWGLAGTRDGQYRSDLAADAAAVEVLDRAGLGVLSEESGLHRPERSLLVVVDPVDGSTNASRRLPFYATSFCALDRDGPRVAVVAQLPAGPRYEAVRGQGSRRDGRPVRPSSCREMGRAVVGVNGWPSRHLGWRQYRALGSAALELCAVADGRLDGFLDLSRRGLAPWDYLGALLVCMESGALVVDGEGRDLVVRVGGQRRSVVGGGTAELLDQLLAGRREIIEAREGGRANVGGVDSFAPATRKRG